MVAGTAFGGGWRRRGGGSAAARPQRTWRANVHSICTFLSMHVGRCCGGGGRTGVSLLVARRAYQRTAVRHSAYLRALVCVSVRPNSGMMKLHRSYGPDRRRRRGGNARRGCAEGIAAGCPPNSRDSRGAAPHTGASGAYPAARSAAARISVARGAEKEEQLLWRWAPFSPSGAVFPL